MIRIVIDASVDVVTHWAGIGMVYKEKKIYRQLKHGLNEQMDNHLAEFYALYYALIYLKQHSKQKDWIMIESDSKIVYDSVRKAWHKRDPYQTLLKACLDLMNEFDHLLLQWTCEAKTKGADRLARQAMRQQVKKMENA